MMEIKKHIIQLTRISFWILNMISVVGISVFIDYTTRCICKSYQAHDFINSIQAIPWYTEKNIESCLVLLGIMVSNVILREMIAKDNNKVIYMSLIIDFICCFLIILTLNFNYTGIIFLVFANVINYLKEKRTRYILIAVAVISFLLTDYELLALSYPIYSIKDYIRYYDMTVQKKLFTIYNVLSSTNMAVFIIYCVQIINRQRETIDEVNMLYKKLQEANNQLRAYTEIAEKMIETRERNRVAREIHDTLGHTLTGVSAGIDACIAIVEVQPKLARQQLQMIGHVVREGIKEIRRSVSALRPDALEQLSLEDAINQMVIRMNKLANIEVYFNLQVRPLKFHEDEENAIYRVIQEGITNAMRHGKATKVWIFIGREDGEVILNIRDNGVGCKTIQYGFGTRHIKERVALLGGKVTFNGENGFVINAQIPVRWGKEYD